MYGNRGQHAIKQNSNASNTSRSSHSLSDLADITYSETKIGIATSLFERQSKMNLNVRTNHSACMLRIRCRVQPSLFERQTKRGIATMRVRIESTKQPRVTRN